MALSELDALARAVPGLNEKAAKQQQAAQRIQARAAVGQAAPGQTPGQISQQVGAPLMQAQQQAGQKAAAQTQQTQLGLGQQQAQQQAFQGQQQLVRQGMQQEAQLGQRVRDLKLSGAKADIRQQRNITDKELKQAERLQHLGMEQDNKILQLDLNIRKELNQIGNDLEDKLFDSRRRFEQDELGRKFTNARQLADAALLTAKNDQDYMDRLQEIEQASKKKALILDIAHKKILQTIEADNRRAVQKISADSKRELAQLANKSKKDVARAQTDAQATSNMINGIATISGAALGAVLAGSATGGLAAGQGAAIGAGVGSGFGQIVSGLSG